MSRTEEIGQMSFISWIECGIFRVISAFSGRNNARSGRYSIDLQGIQFTNTTVQSAKSRFSGIIACMYRYIGGTRRTV